ncbi:MAG: thiol peroxidase [Eggerthellaceae bacterium]|jgi:thiol peroxidase|nr:thiol peroxidase [Eggerthellaceae bacterium]MDR2715625.1 thiol peroxidase [Coriobacteriaceae bacterium]
MLSVTFAGAPLTLEGEQVKVGDKLPVVALVDNDLASFSTADTSGVRVFLTVPSLDTPVCDLEVRTFNQKAADMDSVSIYVVSADLPFAQARWCGQQGIDAVKTLSDHRGGGFALATGTFISELELLTRAVIVVDANDTVTYTEFVPEITDAPDYDAAYAALAAL